MSTNEANSQINSPPMDLICERIQQWQRGENPYLIHEFKHSLFVVGDHQFYRGYSLLLYKEHVRELHELPEETYRDLQSELYLAGKAIFQTFAPWKMNYMSLGNQDPHIHWHIMPRYTDDPYHKGMPLSDSIKGEIDLADHRITAEQARQVAAQVRPQLLKILEP